MDVTILITTRNRKDELRNALASALAQTGDVAIEVLVIDDGSTDGTSEMVRAEFPTVRLERRDESAGLIVRRNEGARLASAPLLVSIDDDALFPSATTIAHTVAEFDDPRIGAVAIPYLDILISDDVRQRAPDDADVWIASHYRGTAHALRLDVFNRLGGYRGLLFHQGEEGDYCVRMTAAGYVTRLGRAEPIHHLESPKRDLTRMIRFNARNHILYAWQNIPGWRCPVRLIGMLINLTIFGLRKGYPLVTLGGFVRGFWTVFSGKARRQPVSAAAYKFVRRLQTAGPMRLSDAQDLLPPISSDAPATGSSR